MQEASWPGNVRQLENVLEQALRLSVTPLVPASLVRRLLREERRRNWPASTRHGAPSSATTWRICYSTTAGNVARAAPLAAAQPDRVLQAAGAPRPRSGVLQVEGASPIAEVRRPLGPESCGCGG